MCLDNIFFGAIFFAFCFFVLEVCAAGIYLLFKWGVMSSTYFIWDRKTKKLQDAFDKQIKFAPQGKTLYVKPKQFAELLNIIPESYKKGNFSNELFYQDRLIKIMPGTK